MKAYVRIEVDLGPRWDYEVFGDAAQAPVENADEDFERSTNYGENVC